MFDFVTDFFPSSKLSRMQYQPLCIQLFVSVFLPSLSLFKLKIYILKYDTTAIRPTQMERYRSKSLENVDVVAQLKM